MVDPGSFVSDNFVPLFERGVRVLEARAEAGDGAASAALADIRRVRAATRLDFEPTETLWLVADAGVVHAVTEAPTEVPVRTAVALPREAASTWIAQIVLANDIESDAAAVRAAQSVSRRLDDALGADSLSFHLLLEDAADFGTVPVRVGLGRAEAPSDPDFTITVRWDDLVEMRTSGATLQQLFLAGKVKLGGDYARAMQLAMQLMMQS
jgi:hypothetical protein